MPTKSKAKPRRQGASAKSAARRARPARARTAGRKADIAQIVTMLEEDHSKVAKLFKRYEKMTDAGDKARFKLAEQICAMLKVHTTIEEELFYPRARDVLGDDEDLIDEAEVEHASAKQLISDIERMETGDPLFDAKVKVLGEYIEHHAEEEEDEMFPKLKKKADDQFAGVFAQMKDMRHSLEAESGAGGKKPRKKGAGAFERKMAELT
jgi:hemerythrin superfamily protein